MFDPYIAGQEGFSQGVTIGFPCNQSMLCIKVKIPQVLDLKEIQRFDLEHCYQTHTPHESWNHGIIAGYRIFRCQILVLSKIRGQHAEAPWNSACAHMFSFFLASIFEIGKWILRLGVQRVSSTSGSHISSCGICVFGVAQACAAPDTKVSCQTMTDKVLLNLLRVFMVTIIQLSFPLLSKLHRILLSGCGTR